MRRTGLSSLNTHSAELVHFALFSPKRHLAVYDSLPMQFLPKWLEQQGDNFLGDFISALEQFNYFIRLSYLSP